jgi:hypothetical protein
MTSVVDRNVSATTDADSVSRIASQLSSKRSDYGSGRGRPIMLRLSPTVEGLLNLAKPESQSMSAFLRECAVSFALRKLDESQK